MDFSAFIVYQRLQWEGHFGLYKAFSKIQEERKLLEEAPKFLAFIDRKELSSILRQGGAHHYSMNSWLVRGQLSFFGDATAHLDIVDSL